MASPPPPPPIAPPPPAIDLRNDEITAPASPASTASSSSSCSSSKASDPNQPKMRPKMSKRRRRRVAKSKAKSDGERSARSLSDEFDYQQRQNRAWLHHQVQLPGRGGVSHYAERELRAVFGKDIEAHPQTNLPMLKSGMTLSHEAEAAYQRLLGERAEMVGQALKGMVPHWWDASVVVPKGKKSRGEKRAARREREKLEGLLGDVGGFGIGEKGVEGGKGEGQGEGDGEEMEVEGEGEDGGVLMRE